MCRCNGPDTGLLFHSFRLRQEGGRGRVGVMNGESWVVVPYGASGNELWIKEFYVLCSRIAVFV